MKWLEVTLALMAVALALVAAVPANAEETTSIRPGGTYTVTVTVKKPLNLKLLDGEWEIRAYFYDGTTCFNTGSWWQPSGGSEWIYSGWYSHRIQGDDWSGEPENRTFQIPVTIVSYPRSDVDISHGMKDLTSGQAVTLRVRLLIKEIEPTFSGSPEEGVGTVSFTIGGVSYRYQYQVDEYGTINLSEQDLINVKLDLDTSTGEYRITMDQVFSVAVSDQASSTGTITIPGTLDVNLTPLTARETTATTLTMSPNSFTLYPGYSGQTQELLATLRDNNNNPLAGKAITWSANVGTINPSSITTNSLGQAVVMYIAPTVTTTTSATIAASFAGDNNYQASSTFSSGLPAVPVSENIPASTGGTVAVSVSGVSVAVNVLVVPPNAISENKTVTVTQTLPENPHTQVMVSNIFDIGPNGTTFNTPSTITLPYDENKIPSWTSEDDLAIYRRTSADDSWERIGGTVNKATNTVSAQIDHLSEYAVMVGTGGAGTGGLPTLTIAVIAVAISGAAVIALLIRRRGGKEEAWAEEVKQKHEGSGDTSIPAIRALFSAA